MSAPGLLLAGVVYNGECPADNTASNGATVDSKAFILTEIKKEPECLDQAVVDDHNVSIKEEQSPKEDAKGGITPKTETSSRSFVPAEIKTEPMEQILPEVEVDAESASILDPTEASFTETPSCQPTRWIVVKNAPDSGGGQAADGVQKKVLPVFRSSLPQLVVPQSQLPAPTIVATTILASPPVVTSLAKRTILTPLIIKQNPTSQPGVTVIRPTPFEMLRPKPVVSAKPGAVVTPIKISEVTRNGGSNRRKQVFVQIRNPAVTSVHQPNVDMNTAAVNHPPVAGLGRSSVNLQKVNVSTPQPKPPTKITLGVDSVEYSAVKALRRLAPSVAASVLTPLATPCKQWEPPANPALTRNKTVGILRRYKAVVTPSQRQSPMSLVDARPADVAQVILPGATDGGQAPTGSNAAVNIADIGGSPTPPEAARDAKEPSELIEFEPDIFNVDSEPNGTPAVMDYPAMRDDGDGHPRRHRGSRKRIVRQPPAILPPPSLTPNGISQSGLVRQPRGVRNSRSAVSEFVCEFEGCGKVFIRKQNLRDHRRVHTNDRPYKCKFCGKAFKQASHVIDHQRLHTKVKPFLCRVCGAGFVQAGQLNNHIRRHTSDRRRPFPCPHCPFGGAEQDELDAHVREAHVLPTIVDPTRSLLDCSLCIYRGVSKADLEEHMNRHVHLRKYACTQCKYRAHTKSRLELHMMLHTGEKPFPCSVCGRRFRQKSQRETHFSTQHRFAGQKGPTTRRQTRETNEVNGIDSVEGGGTNQDSKPASPECVDVKPVILEEVICPD